MKVIYIAGPFKGENGWEIEKNVRHAESWALNVWKAGAVAMCPHTNTRFFFGTSPGERIFLRGYLELVKRCDAVLAIQGWESSSGARAEVNLALAEGKPVFYSIPELTRWLRGDF